MPFLTFFEKFSKLSESQLASTNTKNYIIFFLLRNSISKKAAVTLDDSTLTSVKLQCTLQLIMAGSQMIDLFSGADGDPKIVKLNINERIFLKITNTVLLKHSKCGGCEVRRWICKYEASGLQIFVSPLLTSLTLNLIIWDNLRHRDKAD